MRFGIAGAGLVGRLAAWRLAQAGHRVEVFDPAASADDRDAAVKAAGWTAAGMLSPVAELETGDADVFELGLRSLDLWQAHADGLGIPIGLRREGSLLVAHAADEGAARRVLAQLEARAPGAYRPELLDAQRLRRLEPDIHGPARAWLLPVEGQVDSVRAMRALAQAGSAAGVIWHWGRAVAVDPGPPGLHVAGGGAGGGMGGSEAGAGRFDHVIDARGVGARPDLPVRGVRGEVFWLHAPGVRLARPVRLLHPRHRVYLVPRADDLIVVGASEIESEDRSPVSLRSTVELLAAAHSVIPALAEARVVRTDVNLRPALPDNLPLVQHDAGVTRINGLFRHGWLIAPALIERALSAWLPPAEPMNGAG